MFDLYGWQSSLGTVAGTAVGQSLAFFPSLVGAILVLVLGIILGNWSKTIVVKSLGLLKFDAWVKDTKFKEFMKKA